MLRLSRVRYRVEVKREELPCTEPEYRNSGLGLSKLLAEGVL